MPINPIVLQRRLAEVGRIRIGKTVETSTGKRRPVKLESFRFTSADKVRIEQIAHVYGGTVEAWTPQGGGAAQWEVTTEADSVPIVVPPQPVTSWMELWSGGGCVRRCDGDREVKSDEPCICRMNEDMVCKPTTRLTVLLRDIEGLGSWRLESKGWNAAAELPGFAEMLAQAGGYVPARLYLKQVRRVTDGQTRDFVVPAIAVDGVTPGQLLAGQAQGMQLTGTGEVAQIGAGPAADPYAPFHADLEKATTPEDCMVVWNAAREAGLVGTGSAATPGRERLAEAISARGKALSAKVSEPPVESEPVDGEIVDDADAVWEQVVKAAGAQGMSLSDVEAAFALANGGCSPATASAGELRVFLETLKAAA